MITPSDRPRTESLAATTVLPQGKSTLREAVRWAARHAPLLRLLRRSGALNTLLLRGEGDLWGRFPTRDEAIRFLRPAQRLTYDDPQLASINVSHFSNIHAFDWPILFFLQRALSQDRVRRLTDFGGHVGVKFVAFRSMLEFPDEFVWQVVDVAAICAEGRRRLREAPVPLAFYERLEDAPCDVLLCSGSLQYADKTPSEVVASLPEPPSMVLLNKLPITDGPGFYTLDAIGTGRVPYRVYSASEDGLGLERLGYERMARWIAPHPHNVVRHQRGQQKISMIGEVWCRHDLRTNLE
jgi:putative methyltransferase (TIGR04325 family)